MKGLSSLQYMVLITAVLLVAIMFVGYSMTSIYKVTNMNETYWRMSSPFSIVAYTLSDDSVTLTLANRLPRKAVLTSVSFDGEDIGVPPTAFQAGEEKTVIGKLRVQCEDGKDFSYDVAFVYNEGGLTGMKQIGDKPLVGKCS